MDKTNAMRLLDAKKIAYEVRTYDPSETNGEHIATILGENPNRVFKTLVTEDPKHNHFVFCVPVSASLDLKKAAKVAGVKSISMILQKELLPLTGYIHGGCSPIGMKKAFPTFIEETALQEDAFYISGGRVGMQIHVNPHDVASLVRAKFVDIV